MTAPRLCVCMSERNGGDCVEGCEMGWGPFPAGEPKSAAILDRARSITEGARDKHGVPERNFHAIAAMWSAYLGQPVRPDQVAWCLVLLKAARSASGHYVEDNAVDACGYAALAGELAAGTGEGA